MPDQDHFHDIESNKGLSAWTGLFRSWIDVGLQQLNALLFPPQCIGCSKVDYDLCPQCRAMIQPYTAPVSLDFIDGFCCVGIHTDMLRKSIHDLKYNNQPQLGNILGNLLFQEVITQNWSIDIIIPVPLHSTRFLKRGYNQAKELLTAVHPSMESAVLINVLQRVRETPSQVGKSATERAHNVRDAFAVRQPHVSEIHNKNILIIDDVCTTGATLSACAEALLRAGASKIYAATVSRAANVHADR